MTEAFLGNHPHFWERHRGPFSLMVVRPGKKGKMKSEWLSGVVDGPDVPEEAHALLTDPRDTIMRVHVWSEKDNQFVMTYPARVKGEEQR